MAVKIPLKFLNIEGDGYHLQAKIRINGKSALVIVDTGASRTVFDKTEISKYLRSETICVHDRLSTGLGTSSMESQCVVIGNLSLGTIKLENFDAVILDLKHVNETYAAIGIAPIVGVLGSDVLVAMNAVLDFKRKTLTLQQSRVTRKKPITRKAKASKRRKL